MTSKVFVALRVKAPPQRVFDAFVGEIGAWWRPSGLFQTTPRPPGVLSFEPGEGGRLIETLAGGKAYEIGRITQCSETGKSQPTPPVAETEFHLVGSGRESPPSLATKTGS